MQLLDLTHQISADMPVYPGTEKPKLAAANTIEKDGFRETLLTMYSHTGTHMDAPAHILADGRTLDAMEVSRFAGTGLVIDCTDLGEGREIPLTAILRLGEKAERADFLLFHTGWDRSWGTEAYYRDFPVPSNDVCRWLAAHGKKGIGVDAISIDPVSDAALTNHRAVFENSEMVIIENLTRLGAAGSDLFEFLALPLPYRDADGAPVRAVALLSGQDTLSIR